MQKVNEAQCEYRNGDWGVKYFLRGPKIDWGVILLRPGQTMGEHGHREVEETFYFAQGGGEMIVDGKPHPAVQGDVFRLSPPERHDIRNNTQAVAKVVFIKTPYLPNDKT
jgi:quercetin dioxygenase-like cupin family protein